MQPLGIAILCFIFRHFERRIAATLCHALVGVQLIDSSMALKGFRDKLRNPHA